MTETKPAKATTGTMKELTIKDAITILKGAKTLVGSPSSEDIQIERNWIDKAISILEASPTAEVVSLPTRGELPEYEAATEDEGHISSKYHAPIIPPDSAKASARDTLMEMYRKKARETGNWDDFDAYIAGLVADTIDARASSEALTTLTALNELPESIWENDRFQDGLEMIRNGLKEEQFTAYMTILGAIKDEIDALKSTASAGAEGKGTK